MIIRLVFKMLSLLTRRLTHKEWFFSSNIRVAFLFVCQAVVVMG